MSPRYAFRDGEVRPRSRPFFDDTLTSEQPDSTRRRIGFGRPPFHAIGKFVPPTFLVEVYRRSVDSANCPTCLLKIHADDSIESVWLRDLAELIGFLAVIPQFLS